MKILYGVQGTGNGHIRRAIEIIHHLKELGAVDILLSGTQSDIHFPFGVLFKKHGVSFISENGRPSIMRTLRSLQIRRFARDITSLPLKDYDFVVSDFEPITGWASYFQKRICIGLSNQVSFFSPHVPRPQRKNRFVEYVLKHFVPFTEKIGFHYESYDNFIETPIIPKELRTAQINDFGHIVVYLPAYSLELLKNLFTQIPEIEWHIFSKEVSEKKQRSNIILHPIGSEFNQSLLTGHGLISAAGFQATAEALFLGKKLLAIPQRWHYEQECNAAALRSLGIKTLKKIDKNFIEHLRDWLYNAPIIKMNYPDNAEKVAHKIIKAYAQHK